MVLEKLKSLVLKTQLLANWSTFCKSKICLQIIKNVKKIDLEWSKKLTFGFYPHNS